MTDEQTSKPRQVTAVRCSFCNMAIRGGLQLESLAEGSEALQAQERLILHQDRTHTLRTIASYAVSAIFAVLAASMIMWAPGNRELAANIAAGALLILAAGIAGVTRFRVTAPAFSIEGDQQHKRTAKRR
ncbi:hypothetical protein [Brevundimonas sp.]|uniref:hypothetical protein n=1 Tax=Brevundimonas sp. TaxID=1871086 RepID=UPI003F713B01